MSRLSMLVLIIICLSASANCAEPKGPWKQYISLCVVFKDEAKYIREWVEFHTLVGVRKFYMYSNNSTDKYKSVLEPYIRSGLVKLFEWESVVTGKSVQTQCMAYRHCLKNFGNESRWMGFIDVDEFLFPVREDEWHLWDVLRDFESYGGLVVRSVLFGSSGFIMKPDGPVIENYVFRAPIENPTFEESEDDVLFHVKSIVDSRHGIGCGKYGAHIIFLDEPNRKLVNERYEDHTNPQYMQIARNLPKGKAYVDRIRYNHYKSKSLTDWEEKKKKGVSQGAGAQQKFAKSGNQWESVDRNDVLDVIIHRYLPKLRESLGLVEGEYALG